MFKLVTSGIVTALIVTLVVVVRADNNSEGTPAAPVATVEPTVVPTPTPRPWPIGLQSGLVTQCVRQTAPEYVSCPRRVKDMELRWTEEEAQYLLRDGMRCFDSEACGFWYEMWHGKGPLATSAPIPSHLPFELWQGLRGQCDEQTWGETDWCASMLKDMQLRWSVDEAQYLLKDGIRCYDSEGCGFWYETWYDSRHK